MRLHRLLISFPLLLLIIGSPALARRGDDSVQIVQTPAGTYVCCYDFLVTNRTQGGTKISEFRFRIVSGRGRIVTGETDAPFMWTSQQDSAHVTWFSTGSAYDIAYGQTVGGFHICPRDTGIVRFVWETRNVDSVISSDTVALACRGTNCDEAFFRGIPSDVGAVFDVDLVAGNQSATPINDFHVRRLTPGISFKTNVTPTPTGWTRTKATADTIVWSTQASPLNAPNFIESFRFELNAPRDSNVRLEYWTTTFGDPICRDTVTLSWGLTRRDSVRARPLSDTCCDDIEVRNVHLPASPVHLLTLKVTTPGVRIEGFDFAPPAWRQLGPFGADDSIAFVAAEPLRPLDSATFRSLCFNNANASSDTVNWTWRLWTRGAVIDEGTGRNICLRPLTACDSVAVRIDSTYPAPERCLYFFIENGNSRNAAITRLTLKFSNPGSSRRVRSATPAPGWNVESFGPDSAVFVGNPLVAGDTISPFVVCLSNGDTATRDPVSIRWTTANGLGPICSGLLVTNAIINADCDVIEWTEVPSDDTTVCCFRARVLNRNGRHRDIDRLSLVVDLPVIFASATASAPWQVDDAIVFPSFDVSYYGSVVGADSTSPEFTFCVDMRQMPQRPATIPISWTTMFGRTLVCTDTVRVTCKGEVAPPCDVASLDHILTDGCGSAIVVRNQHDPAGPFDGIDLRIPPNCSLAQVTSDGTFAQVTFDDTSARLRGGTVPAGGSTVINVYYKDVCGLQIPVDITTLSGPTVLCTDSVLTWCTTLDVAPGSDGELTDVALTPNPTTGRALLTFNLRTPSRVAMTIRDLSGHDVRTIDGGLIPAGPQSVMIDLSGIPSGTYFVMVNAGTEVVIRRLTLTR